MGCDDCLYYKMKIKEYKKAKPYCKLMKQYLKDNEKCSEFVKYFESGGVYD